MLKRKFYDTLLDWKQTKKNECLLVKGARQVGKTFIVQKFAADNYKHCIYLNFLEKPKYKEIFDGSLSAEEIFKKISVYTAGKKIIKNETMLFLDEIQECDNARAALKFLAIDGNCDVIASGSLLGINYKGISSIPVGYERQIEMYALDFEEFLWAKGINEDVLSYLKGFFERREPVPDGINRQMFEYLREYMIVGGMPEVVNTFIKAGNFADVHREQNKIMNDYKDDMSKYAATPDKPKIRACYEAIPRQLAAETKKFQYATVQKGANSKKYRHSIDWLKDANLVHCCHNVTTPQFPLAAYEKPEQFKLYISDIGLLVSMYGYDMKAAVLSGKLKGHAKGGIYENLIADMLIKNGYSPNYYKKEDSTQEIEFLISKNAEVIPIEVKATNSSTKSLNGFIEKYHPATVYKLVFGNIGVSDNKITLPHYMAIFL